jgi:hypothetical protein
MTPNAAQHNGMIERPIRAIKAKCTHRDGFGCQRHALRVPGGRIQFDKHGRPHQALGMETPAEAQALAAWAEQKLPSRYGRYVALRDLDVDASRRRSPMPIPKREQGRRGCPRSVVVARDVANLDCLGNNPGIGTTTVGAGQHGQAEAPRTFPRAIAGERVGGVCR